MMTTSEMVWDWPMALVWLALALGIVGLGLLVGLWLINTPGLELAEVFQQSSIQDNFFAGYIP